jgi:hypothetical protein
MTTKCPLSQLFGKEGATSLFQAGACDSAIEIIEGEYPQTYPGYAPVM